MIVERSMHETYLSNTWLVADAAGGHAVFVDAGAPIEPLLQRIDELDLTVTHVLVTHDHHDHTAHLLDLRQRFSATEIGPSQADPTAPVLCGSLTIRPLATPGHCPEHVAWLITQPGAPDACFTGDVLFRGTVGGTMNGGPDGFAQLRHSIMDVLLALDDATVLYPGHVESTTLTHERANNPFILAWSDRAPLEDDPVLVADLPARRRLEAPDYDGGTKVWVEFADGREAIVGGSMVKPARSASRQS